jgi:hypothetical protein
MPSTYSPLLRLELMAIGEKTNTWGTTNNTNLGTLIEKGIAGSTTVDVTAGDVTLTSLNGADDQARAAVLLITGTPGATRNVIAPSTSKMYAVRNGSNGVVMVKGAATTGVALFAGEYAYVGWNGSDFIRFGLSPSSPALQDIPTAPTAAVDTNTAQIATTGFVVGQGYLKATGATTGSYTPVATSASSGFGIAFGVSNWMRLGNLVHAQIRFNYDADSALETCEFDLPFASALSVTAYVAGSGATQVTGSNFLVGSGTANNASLRLYNGITGLGSTGFGLFMYVVA